MRARKRLPPTKKQRETYAERIDRLIKKGYSRAEARGHARIKKGELGIVREKQLAERAAAGTAKDRRQLREEILKDFFRSIPDLKPTFKNRRQWRDRRKLYEPVVKKLLRRFTFDKNEFYSLLFSP